MPERIATWDCHKGLPQRFARKDGQKEWPERIATTGVQKGLPERIARKDGQEGLPEMIATQDCRKGLPEKIARLITDWKNKFLFGGSRWGNFSCFLVGIDFKSS